MGYSPRTGVHETQGTSFSSPLVAGFAACAWQSDTSLTNMQLFKKLEESANCILTLIMHMAMEFRRQRYFTEHSKWERGIGNFYNRRK